MKYIFTILTSFLLAASSFAGTVKLAWDANAVEEEITSYRVYEKVGTSYQAVGTTTGAVTTITILNVAAGKHTYVVTATNVWTLESPYSAEVSTAPGASKPTGLKVVSVLVP